MMPISDVQSVILRYHRPRATCWWLHLLLKDKFANGFELVHSPMDLKGDNVASTDSILQTLTDLGAIEPKGYAYDHSTASFLTLHYGATNPLKREQYPRERYYWPKDEGVCREVLDHIESNPNPPRGEVPKPYATREELDAVYESMVLKYGTSRVLRYNEE